MKRVLFAALICAASFCLSSHRALAVTEFCPARVDIAAVQPANAASDPSPSPSASPEPAALYGMELSAAGPRSVLATVVFDTDAGWFTADIPNETLIEKDRHYSGPASTFIKHDWISPIVYVRFPKPVLILHEWVTSALSQGDSFGWQTQGIVTCLPPGTSWWSESSGPRWASDDGPKGCRPPFRLSVGTIVDRRCGSIASAGINVLCAAVSRCQDLAAGTSRLPGLHARRRICARRRHSSCHGRH